jgi:hypothetical protein
MSILQVQKFVIPTGKSCAKILQVNVFQKDNPSDESDFVQLVELEFHLYYLECGHILSTLVDSSECHDVPTQQRILSLVFQTLSYSGKSCAKILQVNVFQKDNPSETHKMYASCLLPHSLHDIVTLQSLLLCELEAQHL